MNPRNICIHNILTKMDLSGAEDETSLAWIERFFIKTSLSWRNQNKSRPYDAAFPAEVVELNLDFHRKRVSAVDYSVRLAYRVQKKRGQWSGWRAPSEYLHPAMITVEVHRMLVSAFDYKAILRGTASLSLRVDFRRRITTELALLAHRAPLEAQLSKEETTSDFGWYLSITLQSGQLRLNDLVSPSMVALIWSQRRFTYIVTIPRRFYETCQKGVTIWPIWSRTLFVYDRNSPYKAQAHESESTKQQKLSPVGPITKEGIEYQETYLIQRLRPQKCTECGKVCEDLVGSTPTCNVTLPRSPINARSAPKISKQPGSSNSI
ncbi:hypothetical protein M436DRAFT_60835 [Aureobasidium namibiae CBS 147.97]|uniref:Uncharacterized protein n=1 Tax=Aureobasidium namibiae CBS 147.97 TaxID=1043004 RepID=A0A074WV19_9PEZI|nr:uncharacterized protein M436DRAFT_60835 [Aureobasidium namibiae CBS 147.97]KEQ77055.1 hypothetical protein M436DRAFT_60835 [Aureobasidium namibiae CBS 147.97]